MNKKDKFSQLEETLKMLKTRKGVGKSKETKVVLVFNETVEKWVGYCLYVIFLGNGMVNFPATENIYERTEITFKESIIDTSRILVRLLMLAHFVENSIVSVEVSTEYSDNPSWDSNEFSMDDGKGGRTRY